MSANKHAARQGKSTGETFHTLNDWETPDDAIGVGFHAMQNHGLFNDMSKPVCDPCCGSGRILRYVAAYGLKAVGNDIKNGVDYLQTRDVHDGPILTNPPYGKGMAEKFMLHALQHSTGGVGALLDIGFLFTPGRARFLRDHPPAMIVIVPWRIKFFLGASNEQIKSQMNQHCWIIWEGLSTGRYGWFNTGHTHTFWASHPKYF